MPHAGARAIDYDRWRDPMPRVLIIEDDADLREHIRSTLEAQGYRVECAAHGRQAFDLLRATDDVRLVLLDLLMPVMSGWEFRSRQLVEPRWATIPTVVMTATTTLEEAAVEADDLLQKPFTVPELLAVVRRHCGRPPVAAAPRDSSGDGDHA
jgi:CheY-like chemotaxis protein